MKRSHHHHHSFISSSIILLVLVVVFLFFTSTNAKDITATRVLKLKGSGSPLPMRVHDLLGKIYTEKNDLNGQITYERSSSMQGWSDLVSAKLGFSAVEFVVDETVKDLQVIPFMAAPIVIVYNFPENGTANSPPLLLDRETLVDIFNGNIVRWNDRRLQLVNPYMTLPDQPITRVVRSDSSGDSYILTSALSSFSDTWKQEVGASPTPKWPNSESNLVSAATVEGVSREVFETPYSIGYVTLRAAADHYHAYANMRNKFGNIVEPDVQSVLAAMNGTDAEWDDHFTKSIVDSEYEDAWPIAGYSYIVYRPNNKVIACNLYLLLYNYLQWIFTAPASSDIMKQLRFVPLQEHDRAAVSAKLNYMQCRGDYFYEPYRRNLRTGGIAFGFFLLFLVIVAIGVFIVFLFKGGAVWLYNKAAGGGDPRPIHV
jgi:phosphate transport system substrate-binding protein